MNKLRTLGGVFLALPLILFGASFFVPMFEVPPGDGGPGEELLQAMRDGGLLGAIAASHIVIGVGLLVPRTRFLAGLLQLPVSLGILAFHVTMLPEGNLFALIILALNLGILADRGQLRATLGHRDGGLAGA